ncbi:hypothetical protein L1987_82074 [Smallanthus sonchifolius]|uniref:Uncharacterized protein n=1 Tax=Smallanthus sonchifolius TaxID=185202 RepID=A0ACB8YSV3_9ASTR|nr:hypothetical protein L1987_82074 [Smallanthus sonchifolius]
MTVDFGLTEAYNSVIFAFIFFGLRTWMLHMFRLVYYISLVCQDLFNNEYMVFMVICYQFQKYLDMDMISKLPPNIIETILCLLPIQEAARTSIISREWRYHWIKIPKLVFIEDTFQVSTDGAELPVMGQTFDQPSQKKDTIKKHKFFDVIYQVLFMHEAPIHEFTLSMATNASCVEIDHIMLHLSRKNTVKKLKLEFISGYKLPLSIFSFHRLTDLHLTGCDLDYEPMFKGFNNLASLYIQEVMTSRKTLLHLLSSCPLLNSVSLNIDNSALQDSDDGSTVINLFDCLRVIENLSIGFGIVECFAQDGIPQELPIALKLKLEILDDSWVEIFERRDSFRLEDDSDIWLEHLNELEIINMIYRNAELDFVKLILTKSPVLKKLRIFLYNEVAKDEALHISGILEQSPHASADAEVIVEIIEGSCPSSRSVM